ncbi:MAG TPA: glycosyl hydrolase family 18 protein [Spirochaetota bacterium]|nr:glycosyl hydrolase family 18 protein [Spirochaetota bacterium]
MPSERLFREYSVIALAGFAIGGDGRLVRIPRQAKAVADYATKTGLRYYPVIALSSVRDGVRLLSSDSARARAVVRIIGCIREYATSGVHLDFEYLPPERAPQLAVFIRELRVAVKSHDRSLSVSMALFPQIEFPSRWAGFHDFALLAPLLDEAVLMCYDFHRKGSAPGPVVDVRWAEKNISQALVFFKPENLWLGVPAYGYAWRGSTVEVVSARAGVRQAERFGAVRHKSGTLYFEHTLNRDVRKAYIADTRTRKELDALALKHGLKGTALWRLGLED